MWASFLLYAQKHSLKLATYLVRTIPQFIHPYLNSRISSAVCWTKIVSDPPGKVVTTVSVSLSISACSLQRDMFNNTSAQPKPISLLLQGRLWYFFRRFVFPFILRICIFDSAGTFVSGSLMHGGERSCFSYRRLWNGLKKDYLLVWEGTILHRSSKAAHKNLQFSTLTFENWMLTGPTSILPSVLGAGVTNVAASLLVLERNLFTSLSPKKKPWLFGSGHWDLLISLVISQLLATVFLVSANKLFFCPKLPNFLFRYKIHYLWI